MEEIYNEILAILNTIPELKWIDLNVGQLLEDKPPVVFPCALIDIDMPSTEDIQNNIQQASIKITITYAYNAYGDTNSSANDTQRSNSLSYFNTTNEGYVKLQGHSTEKFNSLSRTSQRPQNIRKGLKVIAQNWETSWHDYTAS